MRTFVHTCAVDDVCLNGVCVGAPKPCPQPPSQCQGSRCRPSTGRCFVFNLNDTSPCNTDGCVKNQQCRSGRCTGGTPVLCPNNPNPCMANRCDELTGECVATRLPYGTPCPSSPSGFCEGPFCIGIIPPLNISCAPPPNYCQSYIFKEDSFPPECVLVNVNEGNQCDDGVACTGVRLRHTHRGHSSRGLFDNVAATQRAYCAFCFYALPALLLHTCCFCMLLSFRLSPPPHFLAVDDVCRNGVCVGLPKTCPKPESLCEDSVCDEAKGGQCVVVNSPNRTPCSQNPCSTQEVCLAGDCAGGFEKKCVQSTTVCTTRTCSNGFGKCFESNSIDGSLCSNNGTCNGGNCVRRVPPPVNITCPPNPSPCKVYVFDPAINSTACILRPNIDGTSCDDGQACTSECWGG